MAMNLIEGTFKVVGASPDGDSVRFYPDDTTVWERLHIATKANATGGVQLRLDAIDALETHYTPPHAGRAWHQPAGLGGGASAALLTVLGFTDVVRDTRGTVTSATPETTRGHILTRFADKYGRAVALAFAGPREGDVADGGRVYVEVAELRESVNHLLLQAGWAYPTFYSQLYLDLREDLTATAVEARTQRLGVWEADVTLTGFTLESRDQLVDDVVIMPKIFRRLAEYLTLDESGSTDLTGFRAFLAAHGDRLYTVPDGRMTSLDTLVEVEGQTVRLTVPPERIIFQEG